jgi:hypothetical protein
MYGMLGILRGIGGSSSTCDALIPSSNDADHSLTNRDKVY